MKAAIKVGTGVAVVAIGLSGCAATAGSGGISDSEQFMQAMAAWNSVPASQVYPECSAKMPPAPRYSGSEPNLEVVAAKMQEFNDIAEQACSQGGAGGWPAVSGYLGDLADVMNEINEAVEGYQASKSY